MDQLPGFIAEFEKAAVLHKDVSDMASVHEDLVALTIESGQLCHLEISITGYNEDPRSLYEVPEVRRWFALVAKRWPDILFWLTPGSLWVFILCLNPEMHQRLPDGRLQIAMDQDQVVRQAASSHLGAENLLKKGGLAADRIKAVALQAQQNILAMFQRRTLGDYIVVHPKSGQVVTYRR